MSESLAAVIVAAGSGTRFGNPGKVFERLAGRPVLQYSLELFDRTLQFDEVVLVMGEHSLERGRDLVDRLDLTRTRVCTGGATRSDSVRAGLDLLGPAAGLVAIHDAARPLLTKDLVLRLIEQARDNGAAVPGMPLTDTVHLVDSEDHLVGLLERDQLRAVQTPQVVRHDWIAEAYSKGGTGTDESTLLHQLGYPVSVVSGEPGNIKLTWPFDLQVAEAILVAQEAG